MLARFLARAFGRPGRLPVLPAPVTPPCPPHSFQAMADSLSGLIAREARELAHLEAIEAKPRQQGRGQGLEWAILDLRRTLAGATQAEALLRALAPHESATRVLAEEAPPAASMRPTHADANLVALGRAHDAWLEPDRIPVHLFGEAHGVPFVRYTGRSPFER